MPNQCTKNKKCLFNVSTVYEIVGDEDLVIFDLVVDVHLYYFHFHYQNLEVVDLVVDVHLYYFYYVDHVHLDELVMMTLVVEMEKPKMMMKIMMMEMRREMLMRKILMMNLCINYENS